MYVCIWPVRTSLPIVCQYQIHSTTAPQSIGCGWLRYMRLHPITSSPARIAWGCLIKPFQGSLRYQWLGLAWWFADLLTPKKQRSESIWPQWHPAERRNHGDWCPDGCDWENSLPLEYLLGWANKAMGLDRCPSSVCWTQNSTHILLVVGSVRRTPNVEGRTHVSKYFWNNLNFWKQIKISISLSSKLAATVAPSSPPIKLTHSNQYSNAHPCLQPN